MKRALFLLIVLSGVLLHSQVVFQPALRTNEIARYLRSDGKTEAVSDVILTVTNGGTITSGSTLTLTYNAPIFSYSGPLSTGMGGTSSGNQVVLTFLSNKTFAVNDTLAITEVRVDATVGVTITATLTGASPVTVGSNSNATLFPSQGTPGDPQGSCATGVRFQTNIQGGISTLAMEQALTPHTTVTHGSDVDVIIVGAPAGATVTPVPVSGTSTVAYNFPAPQVSTSSSVPLVFTYSPTDVSDYPVLLTAYCITGVPTSSLNLTQWKTRYSPLSGSTPLLFANRDDAGININTGLQSKITSLAPASIPSGSGDTPLSVVGVYNDVHSVIRWNGSDLATSYVDSNHLSATVPAALLATPGVAVITVFDPTNGPSNSVTLTITGGSGTVPGLTSLWPSTAMAGAGSLTVQLSGANFSATSQVQWNGHAVTTNFASGQLIATIGAADLATAGLFPLTVMNTGGATSNPGYVTVNNPAPGAILLLPASATMGSSGFTLVVNGSNFVGSSQVLWGGSPRATTVVNSTQLTASILAGDVAAVSTAIVTVQNPGPGGGVASKAFAVTCPVPAITSISPSSVPTGAGAITLAVNGSNFTTAAGCASTVQVNGTNRNTTYISDTQLTATLLVSDTATASVARVVIANGFVASNWKDFIAGSPTPSIGSLAPNSAAAGTVATTITVNGANFADTATVLWNGSPRPTTNVSTTQLIAAISIGDLAVPGPVSVTVNNPGGATSSAATFVVMSGCVFQLSSGTYAAPFGGVSSTVRVITVIYPVTQTCHWTAVSNAPFIHVTYGAEGETSSSGVLQPAPVTFTVDANAGPHRTGTITIAGKTLTVVQGQSFDEIDFGPMVYSTVDGAHIPVVAWLGVGLTHLQFETALTINSGGGPGIVYNFGAANSSGLVLDAVLDTPLNGNIVIGDIVVPWVNGNYTLAFNSASGTAPITLGGSTTFDIAPTYMVGDITPSTGDSLGSFGDGVINTVDLLAALRAVTGLPGSVPAPCTDRFDAMDAFPADTAAGRGGDGTIDTLDLLALLRRATGIDPVKPHRLARNGCAQQSTESARTTRLARNITLRFGDAEKNRVPIYASASSDLDLSGLSMSLGADGPVAFVEAPDFAPSLTDTTLPGKLAVAWLNARHIGAGQTLIGYVDVTSTTALRFFGGSAATSDAQPVAVRVPGAR